MEQSYNNFLMVEWGERNKNTFVNVRWEEDALTKRGRRNSSAEGGVKSRFKGENGSGNTHAIWRRVKTGTEKEC